MAFSGDQIKSLQSRVKELEDGALIEQYLKENLTIVVDQSKGFYGEKHCEVILLLDGERISSDSIDLS